MKKGETVIVYTDPLTQSKPEGSAKLLKKEFVNGKLEYWKVRFISDGFICRRNIKSKNE